MLEYVLSLVIITAMIIGGYLEFRESQDPRSTEGRRKKNR